jgi:hypothetical protein
LAGFSGFWVLLPCFRDRSPDEGAPPSLSHCEMPFLGLPVGRLGRVFVVIEVNPSRSSALLPSPSLAVDQRGSNGARATSKPCSERAATTAVARSTRSSGDRTSPGSLESFRVLEGEVDSVDNDREHRLLVLHTNLRDYPRGNTSSPALFRKAHPQTRSAEASVTIRVKSVIRPAVQPTGASSPQRTPFSFITAVPVGPSWTFQHTTPHPQRED